MLTLCDITLADESSKMEVISARERMLKNPTTISEHVAHVEAEELYVNTMEQTKTSWEDVNSERKLELYSGKDTHCLKSEELQSAPRDLVGRPRWPLSVTRRSLRGCAGLKSCFAGCA
jgi:hypothetical protein